MKNVTRRGVVSKAVLFVCVFLCFCDEGVKMSDVRSKHLGYTAAALQLGETWTRVIGSRVVCIAVHVSMSLCAMAWAGSLLRFPLGPNCVSALALFVFQYDLPQTPQVTCR